MPSFFLISVRRVTSMTPEKFYIKVAANFDSDEGHTGTSIEVEMSGEQIMKLSLAELEEAAIQRARLALNSDA